MQDIKQRELKMQEKRKQTPWNTFIKELGSRFPLVLQKNKGIISKFPETDRTKHVLKCSEYEAERETYTKYGIDYDFTKGFFENFKELINSVNFPGVVTYGGIENCDYADISHNTKNAYLVFNTVRDNENIFYSSCVKDKCTNVYNSVMVRDQSQNIYTCTGIIKSYNVFFSKYITDSDNIRCSKNLIGCSECIDCDNLTNQKYCIKNQSFDKETYLQKKKERLKNKQQLLNIYKTIGGVGNNNGSTNSKGNFVINSENIENGDHVYQTKYGRNLVITGSAKGNERMYDVFVGGSNISSDYYGVSVSGTSQNLYICDSCGIASSSLYYSMYVSSCSYCLGCVGLINKSFCIFNKQYTKEERFELANKIFQQMESDGILGDFFPGWMNPFYFNDTAAYLIDDSFTKEEVTAQGYLRRDEEIKVDVPAGADIIETKDLNNYQGFNDKGEREINPEILKKVIKDEKGNYYKIVPMELEFLQKYGLPLPEIHWLERIKLGFKFK